MRADKPLGRKTYGHIPHLPGSRTGPGDHMCHEGQARIATVKTRDKHDTVIVTEKLDGCLPYRTTINTNIGHIAIGKIVNQKLPVLVASYNENNRLVEYKPIEKYHKQRRVLEWQRVTIKSVKHGPPIRSVTCTPNHSFYTQRGYVRADELITGDCAYQTGLILGNEAKQVILGALLGDSSILKPREHNRRGVTFGHSIAQSDYFDFKLQLLGSLVREVKGQRGGFPGSLPNRRAYSRIIPDLHELITSYCVGKDGKKHVTEQWANTLTPLGMAIWYMDDGSVNLNLSQRPRARISTNGFPEGEVQLLRDMLQYRYNIDVRRNRAVL